MNGEIELVNDGKGFEPVPAANPAGSQSDPPAVKPPELPNDGPTLVEWCAAGYDPKNYPPTGYAARVAAVVEVPPHILNAQKENARQVADHLKVSTSGPQSRKGYCE